jgi:hypothetical protein
VFAREGSGIKGKITIYPWKLVFFKVALDSREFNHLPGALGEGHPYSQG